MAANPLFKFKQGDHVCVFYEDENAMLDLLVPFMLDGLRKGERCFCAESNSLAVGLVAGLTSSGVDTDSAIARGALEIRTLDEFYGPDTQSFDPQTLMRLLKNFILESRQLGFTASRMAGEMQFVLTNNVECNSLLEYEALVDAAYPGLPVLGICQYNTRLFDREMLDKVLEVHRKSMAKTMITSNHSSLAIRKGRYLLDIVADRVEPSSHFYYVAQERGKPDILGWGVERDFDSAVSQGETLLNSLQAAGD